MNPFGLDISHLSGLPGFVYQWEMMPKIHEFHATESAWLTWKLLNARLQDGRSVSTSRILDDFRSLSPGLKMKIILGIYCRMPSYLKNPFTSWPFKFRDFSRVSSVACLTRLRKRENYLFSFSFLLCNLFIVIFLLYLHAYKRRPSCINKIYYQQEIFYTLAAPG